MSVQKTRIKKANENKVTEEIKSSKPAKNTIKNNSVYNRKSNSKDEVDRWVDFSTNPQREEDIRYHLLDPELRDSVCVTYICQYSPMSCTFIEELIALSTNMFTPETYTEENIKFVLDVIRCIDEDEAQKIVEKYQAENPKNKFMWFTHTRVDGENVILKAKHISTRVDWFNINKHQQIDPWFKEKWGHMFTDRISASSKSEMSTWENY